MPSSTGTLVFNDQKIQAPDIYATESLGVGVSDPTSNLQVVGNAYVSSNLEVGTANLFVDTTTGRVGVGRTDPRAPLDINSTGAMIIPVGTTQQRPSNGVNGMLRLNTNENTIEFYNSSWLPLNIGVPISENGLVVKLDAANNSSYPGSGTTWYDVSGNTRNGTLRGNASWVNDGIGSYFDFDGSNSTYIDQTSGLTLVYKDICIAFYVDAFTNGYASLISNGTGTDKTLRASGSTSIRNPGDANDWSDTNSGGITYYVNGVADTNDVSISTGTWYILGGKNTNDVLLGSAWNYHLGTGLSNRHLNGRIAFVALYDRELTPSEHIQNYNALRSRFNI